MTLNNMSIPIVIVVILGAGLWHKVDIFSVFLEGAKEGFHTAVKVLPAMVALMTCIGMFKASGALDILSYAITPIAKFLQLPTEVVPFALLRPISGSGGLVLFNDLLKTYGPDSYIGRVASVMEGSTETTFYTIAVYYGATKIARTRHTLPASLTADLVGFVASAFMVRLIFGMA
ncbi:nucleoside recognition domain-containing protein [Oscillospiraceae bacterium MB08-C2-2]|nr:nucleoside recognition domain-containing protein [Oscillospiraceae bacterium MB08-C2-2]